MGGKLFGGVGGLVVIAIIFFVRMGATNAKVEEFGEQTKTEFLASIADHDVCKGDQRNYVEWLANTCHEECWKNNHDLEPAGRRRTDVVIDEAGYQRDMLSAMADMARGENAPHIATGLMQIHQAWFSIE